MLKKIVCIILTLAIVLPVALTAFAEAEDAQTGLFQSTARSYILMEATTGQVIAENNADEALHAAGVTKIMSFLLFYEAIKTGAVKIDDGVRVSPEAANKTGTRVFLDAGETYTFDTLLKPAIVCSANDATTALAEHIAGSEAAFVERMNDRAKELGLSATFADCTGTAEASTGSARDYAIIAAELSKHSGFFKHSTEWTYTFQHNSGRETVVTNANTLIKDGDYDGMMTGSSADSGYSLAATTKSGAARYICIVLGDINSNNRFSLARETLSYASATFGIKQIAEEGAKFKSVEILGGTVSEVELIAKADLSVLYRKGEEGEMDAVVEVDELVAPIRAGDIVGKVVVNTPEGQITVALAAGRDVPKNSIGSALHRILKVWLGIDEDTSVPDMTDDMDQDREPEPSGEATESPDGEGTEEPTTGPLPLESGSPTA